MSSYVFAHGTGKFERYPWLGIRRLLNNCLLIYVALVQLEQAAANSRCFLRILDDLKLVLTPPVRLMFLAFEADAFRPSSQAGCHLLKGMVATLPESKIIEDRHGVIRVDAASKRTDGKRCTKFKSW